MLSPFSAPPRPRRGAERDVRAARCTALRQRIARCQTLRPRTRAAEEALATLRPFVARWRCG